MPIPTGRVWTAEELEQFKREHFGHMQREFVRAETERENEAIAEALYGCDHYALGYRVP